MTHNWAIDPTYPRTRRVLIVGINYAPEYCGIAPYTTTAAEHLAREGNDVLVLTGVEHYPHWRVPRSFRLRLRAEERREGVSIRKLRHFVPSKQSALRRALYEVSFGAHVLVQHVPWRPDVVLAVVPSLLGATAAALIARHYDAPLGVWIQDLMGQAATESGIRGGRMVAKLTARAEQWLLTKAKDVAVISESHQYHIEALGVPADCVHYIPNWTLVKPPTTNRQLIRARLGWPEGTSIALHTGNMGLKQGLENIIDAGRLAYNSRSPIRFVLMGDGSQRDVLSLQATDLPTVEFRPPVPSDEYTDVLSAADFLVINERVGMINMCLPSKLTSYFIAGRPIIAAVHPNGATALEVQRSGGGHVIQSGRPDLLLNEIRRLSNNPAQSKGLGANAQAYAKSQLGQQTAMHRLTTFLETIGRRQLSNPFEAPHHKGRRALQ